MPFLYIYVYICRHHHRHHSRHKHNEREIFIPKDDLQIDENLDEFLQDDLTSKLVLIFCSLLVDNTRNRFIIATNNTRCKKTLWVTI